jgi:outer membrane protein OmpA-like peptidoglycan-associated protein
VLRAKEGIAMQFDPAGVHQADVALRAAEEAWRSAPNDPTTTDLALIADRKAQIAQAQAMAVKADQDRQQATSELEAMRAAQLTQTRLTLGATQMQLQEQQAATARDQQRLQTLEADLKDARDVIAKIASVKNDDRGMVITLQGEVLFKSGKSDLKPAAMAKLDRIAAALKGKDQPIAIFGYTDSVGAAESNMRLSQMRADSVRGYLVSKGLARDLVTAQGRGPESPVSDNESIEGRAQNRRVEIVVQPKP